MQHFINNSSFDNVSHESECEPEHNSLEKTDIEIMINNEPYHIDTIVNLPEDINEINIETISELVATVPNLYKLLDKYNLVYIKHDSKIYGVIGRGALIERDLRSIPFKMHYSEKAETKHCGKLNHKSCYFIIITSPFEIVKS